MNTLTDDEIDGLLSRLHEIAQDYSPHEFGLPIDPIHKREQMRAAVRAALRLAGGVQAEPVATDYYAEMEYRASCVYDYATGGKCTKPTTDINVVKSLIDEHVNARIEEALEDERDELPADRAALAQEIRRLDALGLDWSHELDRLAAAPSTQPVEHLSVGVCAKGPVTIAIHQCHADGSQTVIHSGNYAAGDSVARVNLAAARNGQEQA